MDGCQIASIAISQHKARTAAKYRRPTLVFETLLGKGPYYSYLLTLNKLTVAARSRGATLHRHAWRKMCDDDRRVVAHGRARRRRIRPTASWRMRMKPMTRTT